MAVYTVYSSPTVLNADRVPVSATSWLPEGSTVTGYPGYFIVDIPEGKTLPETLPPYATVVEGYPPLTESGVLATLLVVNGAIDIADAANAVNRAPANLVAEAQAWAVASVVPKPPVKRGRKKSLPKE